MSQFSLSSLNFQNKFLSTGSGPIVTPNQTSVPDLSSFNIDNGEKHAFLSDGKRITLKKKNAVEKPSGLLESNGSNEDYGFNINELYARLEVQRLKQSKLEASSSSYISKSKLKKTKNDNKLWAEKWRPNSFLDFVGNELTNRKLLTWLKQWDKVVFSKDLRPITEKNAEENASMKYVDALGRPNRKVLLIHGPPGIGKTTIAHVIAKQLGYEVMEINASDERAGQRVKDKILNSISSITFSGKPVCLIADEVDGGSEFGFIKVLNDLIYQDSSVLYKYSKQSSSKYWTDKDGENRKKLLLRPIIAICNDVYVPALEKLRLHSEIISFKPVDETSLRDRLKFICQNEKIQFSNQQLKEIITLTNHDIRSCLNILQFSGNDNGDINKNSKDLQISWFSIVQKIFQTDRSKSKREQFNHIIRLINSTHSNFDKIINGCFQTYIESHYQDIKLSKPSLISDWLYFSDIFQKTQYTSGFDLSHYSELTALQFFNQFNNISNSDLKIKSQDWEFYEKTRKNNNIIEMMFNKVSANLRTSFNKTGLSVELIPLLESIITPELNKRAINANQDNKKNKSKINDAIDALGSMGLLINKAKDENYNEVYKTYPEFTEISKYDQASAKKQVLKQTQVFPILLKEMQVNKELKRKYDSSHGDEVNDIEILKTQYNQLAENERLAKKQKTQVEVKIWVKYHEGFSNAVRKNIKWNDLW